MAAEPVGPEAADEDVVSLAAGEGVLRLVAAEVIAPAATVESVATAAAGQVAGAVVAAQLVVAGACIEPVGAVATVQRVGGRASGQHVVAGSAVGVLRARDHLGARPGVDRALLEAAGEIGRTVEAVVAVTELDAAHDAADERRAGASGVAQRTVRASTGVQFWPATACAPSRTVNASASRSTTIVLASPTPATIDRT